MHRSVVTVAVVCWAFFGAGCGLLVTSGADVTSYTPLFSAVEGCDLAEVQSAVEKQPSLVNSARERGGARLLHDAVDHHCAQVVSYLLARGANPNSKKADGVTPLHLAAMNGELDVMADLLAHGARVNIRDNQGWTALDRAQRWTQPNAAVWLKAHGGING